MSSFPNRLPVEVTEHIANLAIALGMMSIKDATLVCHRWKLRYRQALFESVTLDPFSTDIPDLEKHAHLVPCIEVLRVAHRSCSSTPPNYERDITEHFTKFLTHANKVKCLLLLDTRIQWKRVSPNTINAFRAVFERPSFLSLEVSARSPLPSWMLLHGTSIASRLTLHCVESIVAPREPVELVSYQCSLTSLVLYGNSSVQQMATFFLQYRELAVDLLRYVVELNLDYMEVYDWIGSRIVPYVDTLVGFLAPQLEDLRLCIKSSTTPPSYVPASAISKLTALQRLSIHLVGCSIASTDTLASAENFVRSVFFDLPSPCPVKSFSLRVDDRRECYTTAANYESSYVQLLSCIYEGHLGGRHTWPLLTSSNILINVTSSAFKKTLSREAFTRDESGLQITSRLQVNTLTADDLVTSDAGP